MLDRIERAKAVARNRYYMDKAEREGYEIEVFHVPGPPEWRYDLWIVPHALVAEVGYMAARV